MNAVIITRPARTGKKIAPMNRGIGDGAGDEARTRGPQLGKLMLYQLSYSRACDFHYTRCGEI